MEFSFSDESTVVVSATTAEGPQTNTPAKNTGTPYVTVQDAVICAPVASGSNDSAPVNTGANNNDAQARGYGSDPTTNSSSVRAQDVFSCPHCAYTSSRKSNMKRHSVVRYLCDICRKSFSTESYRKPHLDSHDQDGRDLCHVCAQSFSTASALYQHLKVHENKFSCGQCNRFFSTQRNLTIHINTHIGAKDSACVHCGRAFVDPSNCHRHEKDCVNNPEPRRYPCKTCGNAFGTVRGLKQHETGKHGEPSFHCPCGKSFTWQACFSRHSKKSCPLVKK